MRFLFLLACVAFPAVAQMTSTWRNQVLAEHNRLRRTLNTKGMMAMEYDSKLEQVAQNYLNKLTTISPFKHNSNRAADYKALTGRQESVGENWYSGAPIDTMTGGAAKAWVDFVWPKKWGFNDCSERQNYYKSKNALGQICSGDTGHFTQVTNEKSYKVGCGYRPKFGTICNYIAGHSSPYWVMGTKCSACPSTHTKCCKDANGQGLCCKPSQSAAVEGDPEYELPADQQVPEVPDDNGDKISDADRPTRNVDEEVTGAASSVGPGLFVALLVAANLV